MELASAILFGTEDIIETVCPVDSQQTYHRQNIRTPTPAERFMSNGLKSFTLDHALPPSMKVSA